MHYLECYLGYECLYDGIVGHYSSTTATRGHRTQGTPVAMGDDWRGRDQSTPRYEPVRFAQGQCGCGQLQEIVCHPKVKLRNKGLLFDSPKHLQEGEVMNQKSLQHPDTRLES